MPLPKSFALAEESCALTRDEHAKAANKISAFTGRKVQKDR